MRDWVSIDHQVEHVTGLAGEVSCGQASTKMSLFGRLHTKVFARGYRGEYLPSQERRIRISMRLDRYLAMDPA